MASARQDSATSSIAPRFYAIVPAAGRSARMGQPKLLLPWGVTTIIEHGLAQWRASIVTRIVVVVHPDDDPLAQACRSAGAVVVQPATPPAEMKASVRHALDWLAAHEMPTDHDAWLLAPADMPLLTTAAMNAVMAAHDPRSPSVLAPVADGRRGHPVLFPWPLAADVARLGANEGLNAIVRSRPVREIAWPNPREILTDIDTPEDYRANR